MSAETAPPKTAKEFIQRYGADQFTPCAFFVDSLDEVVIFTADCSFTQHCVSGHIDLYAKNHNPNMDCCIGMAIKGVRHFFESFEIAPPESWKIQDLVELMTTRLGFDILGNPANRDIIHHILDEYGELAVPHIPA